ncbi:hypothetical protein [Bradyrhizobium sp. HKCCYLS20291]|uniref:hypothetical protein n=1 Tax=Bradyrhizobium sp. HKCCYLS20291 TaxID=3420766 RepID=UPI003EBFEC95
MPRDDESTELRLPNDAEHLQAVDYAGESPKPQKIGSMYAHYGEGDIVDMAIYHNAQRALTNLRSKTKKPLYDLIVGRSEQLRAAQETVGAMRRAYQKEFRETEEKIRELERQFIEELVRLPARHNPLSDEVTKIEHETYERQMKESFLQRFHKLEIQRARLLAFLESIEETKIFGPGRLLRLKGGLDKLYILGHGSAGDPELSTKLSKSFSVDFSVGEVAKKLRELDLSDDFSDFRLLACYSADGEECSDFEESGMSTSDGSAKPPATAQIFLDELIKAGFTEAVVCGYHQLGAQFSDTGQSIRRNRSGTSRRSEVARRFFRAERSPAFGPSLTALPQTARLPAARLSVDNQLTRPISRALGMSPRPLSDARPTDTALAGTDSRFSPRASNSQSRRDRRAEAPAFETEEMEEAGEVADAAEIALA